MADQVVSYKGEFDASNIMSAIEKVYSTIKANNKTSLIGNLDKEIKKIETLTNTLQAQKNKGFASDAEIKSFESNVGKLDLQVQKLGVSFSKLHADNLKIELKEIEEHFKKLKKETKEVENNFKNAFKITDFKGSESNLNKITQSMIEAAKAGKSLAEAQKEIEKTYTAMKRSSLNTTFDGLTDKSKTAVRRQDENWLTTQSGGIQASWFEKSKDFDDFKKRFQEGMRDINKDASQTSTIIEGLIGKFRDSVKEQSRDNFSERLKTAGEKQALYSNALREAIRLDEEETQAITALTNSTEQYNAVAQHSTNIEQQEELAKQEAINKNNQQKKSTDELVNSLTNMMSVTRQSTQSTKEAVATQTQLMNTLDRLKSRIGYIFSLGNAYYQLRRVLKQTLTDVNNIDKAFASIAMVTEKTVNGLWEHYGEYATLAQKLGQSTESAIKTSALFYQQGLKDAEVMRLTEDTMKLATLAGLDFEKATSQMTAALRGFHMEMEESSHVTDVYSELAAHAAADVNGIAYAMSKTASIANSAGMSFENTAAFLTQMIETTQEAPENIGTALKTIIARFTELKENVAGTSESEFDDLDYNKVDKALKTVGISIKDTTGQFRNLDEVFLELSSKWNTLDRNSQRYIATIAAGSRQQSRFIAMMEDYDRVMELVNVTTEAQGRADQQFAKNAESLQFKLQSLKTAWEQLRISFADSDFFKGAVDSLTKFVNLVSKMDKGQLAVVATIGVTIGTNIITSLIDTLRKGATKIHAAWEETMGKSFITNPFSKAAWKGYGNNFMNYTKTNWLGDSEYLQNGRNFLVKEYGATGDTINAQNFADLKGNLQDTVNAMDEESTLAKDIAANEAKIAQLKSQGTEESLKQAESINKTNEDLYTKWGESVDKIDNKLKAVNTTAQGMGMKPLTGDNVRQLNSSIQQNQGNNSTLNRIFNSENGQILAKGAATAATAAITSAFTMALSGADFKTIIKTTLITAVTAILPSVISTIGPTLIGLIAPPAGIIVLIIAAVITGLALIIKKNKEARDAEAERLAKVKEANEKLIEQAEQLIDENKKNQEEAKKLKKYREIIQKYNEKDEKLLTNTQKKELEEAQNYIKENYEDAYRETWDGHFKIIESKMDSIIEKMEKDSAAGQLLTNIEQRRNNYNDRLELLKDYQKTFEGNKFDPNTWLGTKLLFRSDYSFGEDRGKNEYSLALEDLNQIFREDIPAEFLPLIEEYEDSGIYYGEKISELIEDLIGITQQQEREALREGNEQILQLQGWDAQAAKIASYYETSLTEGNQEIAEKISSNLVENLSSGQYSKLGTYEDDIRNALSSLGYDNPQDLFDKGSNLKKWDELTEELRAALDSMGMSKKEWDNGTWWSWLQAPTYGLGTAELEAASQFTGEMQDQFLYDSRGITGRAGRKNASVANAIMSKIIANEMLESNELFIKENQEFFDKNKEIITNYASAELDYAGKSFEQYKSSLNNIYKSADQDVQELLAKYDKQNQESVKNIWESSIKNLEKQFNIDEKIVNKFSYDVAINLNDILETATAATKDKIIEYINKNTGNLSTADWQVLGQLDLEDISSIGLDGSQQYVDQLIAAGHNAEEAANIFNNYIKMMRRATFQDIAIGKDSSNILKENIREKISGLPEQFASILDAQKEMLDKGYITQKTYLKLMEDGFEDYVKPTVKGYELIGDKAQEFYVKQALSAKDYVDGLIETQKETIAIVQKYINSKDMQITLDEIYSEQDLEKRQKMIDSIVNSEQRAVIQQTYNVGAKSLEQYNHLLQEGLNERILAGEQAYFDGLVAINEQYKDAIDKVQELKDKLEDLNKQYKENQESLEEAERKYQEALYGTKYYRSSLDDLENYNKKLDITKNNLDNIKTSLEDVSDIQGAADLFSAYQTNSDSKIANLMAQINVYNNAMNNLKNRALSEFGEFVKFNGDELIIDESYQLMDKNDEYKKGLEEIQKTWYNYYKARNDAEKDMKDERKQREKEEKEYLKRYTEIQTDIIDILKEKAKEEVDITKDKYEALKEADSDYINALEEAIQKQRELRNLADKEDDLAQKEKKLSLMQRDTSGANAKEIKSLEEEINKDRQDLLDKNVDNIINNMKELYEKQAEARDAEIEYMESVTENAQYFSDWAKSIMDSWNSIEDMQTWFLENDTAVEDMTVEQQEVYINDLKEKWSDLVKYQALQVVDFKENADNINLEATELMNSLSENATTKADAIIEDMQRVATEAEESAKKTRDKALEAIQETEKQITETQDAIKQAEIIEQGLHGAAMTAMADASKEAMENVSVYAVQVLADFLGVNLADEAEARAFAEENGFVNSNGQYSDTIRTAIKEAGGNISLFPGVDSYKLEALGGGAPTLIGYYGSKEEAQEAAAKQGIASNNVSITKAIGNYTYGSIDKAYQPSTIDSPLINNTNPQSLVTYKGEQEKGLRLMSLPEKTLDQDGEIDPTALYIEYEEDNEKKYYKIHEREARGDIGIQELYNKGKIKNNSKVYGLSIEGGSVSKQSSKYGLVGYLGTFEDYNKMYNYKKYATGGLVPYTGLAHVDGTPSRPEAFLSAEDTERFLTAAELFAMSPLLNSSSAQNMSASSVGDTSIEININVENIADDYDVDRLIQRVEDDIVETAKPIGTQVILNKRV